ncbi:hypothetical protein M902_1299 [Bacteriovorax sp. BAL6_X]|uniref:hypothetical protein n=1 Tax=Bacteriovorax sp. BAL6_X TaxID=1201290 RepID=UPI000385D8DD|nr:hypothetical protein [Bacteriovorax sp. BAL6_X]EPZ50400.1 hypothetical protein M902_1299 [Bacteriovorax sp. BAL6_X]
MKTKSPLKIIFLFLGSIIVFSAIILIVAKKNLKPDAIRKAFTTQLQKTLPNAEVLTQSLDYSLGINSKVNIRGVDILYPHGGRKLPLCSFENLQIEIPFWTMLMGYGTISVNIDNPKVSYIEFKKGSNWENSFTSKEIVSFKEEKKVISKEIQKEGSDSGLAVLSFFSDASLNFNVTNINANYALRSGSFGEVNIEKLALRDIGLNTTSVFELKSHFILSKGKPNETSFDVLIIGETVLDKWLEEKKLNFNAEVDINNVNSSVLIKPLKKFSLKMDGGVENRLMSSKIVVALEEHQFMKSNLDYDFSKEVLKLSNINLVSDLNNITSYFVNVSDFGVKIKDGQLKVEGSLTSRHDKLFPNITTSVESNMIALGIPVVVNIKNNLNSKQIRSAIELKLLEGSIKVGQRTPFVLGVDRFDYLKTSDINLHLQDIQIPTEIKESMPKQKTVKEEIKEENTDVDISSTNGEVFSNYPVKSKIKFSNVMLGESPINGQVELSVNRKKLNILSNRLKLGTAPLNIKVNSEINKKGKTTELAASFSEVDISSAALFVPHDIVKSIEGKASGKVDGKLIGKGYDFNVALNVKEAKLHKINLANVVGSIFKKLEKLANKDISIDGDISELSFNGRLDDRYHQFKSYKVVLDEGKYALEGNGKIDFKAPGELLGAIIVNEKEIKHDLERDYGTAKIPYRLEGVGYALTSDYEFTIEKLAKSAAKNLLKKETDKVLQKNKVKIKKLFKGIFKND